MGASHFRKSITQSNDKQRFSAPLGKANLENGDALNYQHYCYRVIWSEEDEEFIGLCAEFPSLSYLDENRDTAFEGISELVQDILTEMQDNGETIPEPLSAKNYSGKFQVRIPPELHRKLAMEAAEENVSLNRYISHKLAL